MAKLEPKVASYRIYVCLKPENIHTQQGHKIANQCYNLCISLVIIDDKKNFIYRKLMIYTMENENQYL